MRSRRGQKFGRAFTLLETVVATVIFSTAVVSLALLFSGAHQGTARSLHQMCANTLAQKLIEEVVEDARQGVVPKASTGTVEITSVRRGAPAKTAYDYNVAVAAHAPAVFDALVTVRWTYQDKQFDVTREVLVSPRR